jgi:hypothetical protein
VTPDQRTAWLSETRTILDTIEAHPELPLPYISGDGARFYLISLWGPAARRAITAVEEALTGSLGLTFTGATEGAGTMADYYYVLTAVMPGGLPVEIKAVANEVAEQKVTGQTVTEVTEWVRRPAEPPDTPQDSTGGAP